MMEAPSGLSHTSSPTEHAIWPLAALAAVAVSVTIWATVVNPLLGVLVAAAPVAFLAIWALTRSQEVLLGAILFGGALVIISREGVGAPEVGYAAILTAYLGYWYGSRLWTGERICRGLVDRAVAILLVVFIPLGIVIGLGVGAAPDDIRGDAMGFAALAYYFPAKEAVRKHPKGAMIVAVAILWLGIYAATHTMLNFRSMIAVAVVDWQVADARPGYNGIQLTAAGLVALALAIHARSKMLALALLVVFAYLVGTLILIKYRAFWLAMALGIVALGVLVDRPARKRLVLISAAGIALAAALFFFVLGDLMVLFLAGTADRAATFGGLERDISLINRFWEAGFVLDLVKLNPIVGYGFGTRYDYYNLVYRVTYEVKHIHIGYVAPLFRLGLIGTALLFLAWGGGAIRGWQAYRSRVSTRLPRPDRALAIASAAMLISMIPSVLSESPWFLVNMMLGFALVVSLGVGLFQRAAGPSAAPANFGQ